MISNVHDRWMDSKSGIIIADKELLGHQKRVSGKTWIDQDRLELMEKWSQYKTAKVNESIISGYWKLRNN